MNEESGPDQSGTLDDLTLMLENSSPESVTEDTDFLKTSMSNSVTATLVKAGPAGVSAAAAILSGRNKKRPHSFETNPCVRKRHTTRLIRKLRHTLEEFAARVGQQAIVLVVNPIESSHNYKVYGTKPLLDIVRNLQTTIMDDLKTNLIKRAPPQVEVDPSLYPLPPLDIDGIPTPVEKMTQAQLRAFIPYMLKYSTLRGKPGWGRENTKPPWWPVDLPWANVRMDVRSESEKQKVPWTHALRKVVQNCYKYHGREDLLPAYSEESMVPDIKAETEVNQTQSSQNTMDLHTITNVDGTVSIVHIDPSNSTITLPDGSTAKVEVMTMLDNGAIQATINSSIDGQKCSSFLEGNEQIILTGEDGQINEVIPLAAAESILQNKGTNILQLTTASDGTVYFTPVKIICASDGDGTTVTTTNMAIDDIMPSGNADSEGSFQMFATSNGVVAIRDINSLKAEEN